MELRGNDRKQDTMRSAHYKRFSVSRRKPRKPRELAIWWCLRAPRCRKLRIANNAGGAIGRYPFTESSEEDEEWMIEANVTRADPDDAPLPAAHPRRRAHRQHGLDRRQAGVRERRRLLRGQGGGRRCSARRSARTCSAGRSASPISRPGSPAAPSSRSSASRATRRRRPRSTRASSRSPPRTSPTACSSR